MYEFPSRDSGISGCKSIIEKSTVDCGEWTTEILFHPKDSAWTWLHIVCILIETEGDDFFDTICPVQTCTYLQRVTLVS